MVVLVTAWKSLSLFGLKRTTAVMKIQKAAIPNPMMIKQMSSILSAMHYTFNFCILYFPFNYHYEKRIEVMIPGKTNHVVVKRTMLKAQRRGSPRAPLE